MASRSEGYFEAFINGIATRPDPDARRVMEEIRAACGEVLGNAQVRWAGSQYKGTAVLGSDLDLCAETQHPVTAAQRRSLRSDLEGRLGRPATIHSHVIRLPAQGRLPKLDLSFAKAEFGSRPLPDAAPFKGQPQRIQAVRAFKFWTRSGALPNVAGWATEQLVIHLDQGKLSRSGLDLFLHLVDWLESRSSPQSIEGILRPHAHPAWKQTWSAKLPGQVEALRNHARRLKTARPQPQDWATPDNVKAWLSG